MRPWRPTSASTHPPKRQRPASTPFWGAAGGPAVQPVQLGSQRASGAVMSSGLVRAQGQVQPATQFIHVQHAAGAGVAQLLTRVLEQVPGSPGRVGAPVCAGEAGVGPRGASGHARDGPRGSPCSLAHGPLAGEHNRSCCPACAMLLHGTDSRSCSPRCMSVGLKQQQGCHTGRAALLLLLHHADALCISGLHVCPCSWARSLWGSGT